jgi:hypothetical protein
MIVPYPGRRAAGGSSIPIPDFMAKLGAPRGCGVGGPRSVVTTGEVISVTAPDPAGTLFFAARPVRGSLRHVLSPG